MPSKSKKQAKAMRAACHDPKTRKAMGISKKAACEWSKEDSKLAKRMVKRG
jgi:hypothetical protein